jgi:DNA polymerase-1
MYQSAKIIKIEKIGIRTVADITVENDHSYIGNGIISHNSSMNPNLQNIPAEADYRKAFVAPDGFALLNADYSSQESRVLAEVSGDEAMINFFNNGHPIHGSDYHCFTATKMFSLMRNDPNLIITKKTHPDERNAAKSISFKIAYGGSAHTLKDDFGVEEDVAQEFIDSYMKAFPALDNYFKAGREKAVKWGYVDIVPDRRYWEPDHKRMEEVRKQCTKYYPRDYKDLPEEEKVKFRKKLTEDNPELKGMWSEYYQLKGSIERCSQNYPIQGLAGSQTKMAGVLFRRYQIENNLRDKLYLTSLVHDECLSEVVKEMAEEGLKVLEEKMIEGANLFCKKVKMGATGNICEYWSH